MASIGLGAGIPAKLGTSYLKDTEQASQRRTRALRAGVAMMKCMRLIIGEVGTRKGEKEGDLRSVGGQPIKRTARYPRLR